MTGRLSRGRLAGLFGAFGFLLLVAGGGVLVATRSALFVVGLGLAIVLIALGALYLVVARAFDAIAEELREEGAQRRRVEDSHRVLVETSAAEARRREAGESQSLENLGHVASGVAHDFNNLLGVILNFTGFVNEQVEEAVVREGEERWRQARKDLAQVQLAAERGAELTHKLQAFARRRGEVTTAVGEQPEPTGGTLPSVDFGRPETVLIVEEEEALREVAARMLARNGYRVLTAEGGVAALLLLKDFDGVVDLLVTDVVMPDMLGREFAEKAQLLRPSARVLFISGHAERVLNTQGRIAPGHSLLEKPFTEKALLAKVRSALQAIEVAGGPL